MRTIYLPRQQENPYMARMWDMVTNMAMMKASANIRAKEAEAQRNYEQGVRQEEGKVKMATSGYRPVQEVSKEHAALQKSGDAIEAYGEVWGPKDPKLYNVNGRVFADIGGTLKDVTNDPELKTPKPITLKVGDKYETYIQTNDPRNNYLGIPGAKKVASAERYQQGDVNVTVDMTKKTQADLEGEIVQGKATLAKLDRVKNLYKPEFLQWTGKSKAWVQDKISKAGGNTGEWFDRYNKWKMEVDAHTLMWRKFITGVAGGEKEMEAIERTTINTKYDSPASAEAKMEQLETFTNAAMDRARFLLKRGFDVGKMTAEQRAEIAKEYPLEDFGYEPKDIPSDTGNEGLGEYEVNAVYEDAEGNQMRFEGYGKNGEPIWGEP